MRDIILTLVSFLAVFFGFFGWYFGLTSGLSFNASGLILLTGLLVACISQRFTTYN